jgi:hypothetical protein
MLEHGGNIAVGVGQGQPGKRLSHVQAHLAQRPDADSNRLDL